MNYKEVIEKIAKVNSDVELNYLQKRVIDNPTNKIIMAHPVGSGKTLGGIAKFEDLKRKGKAHKALVVTPAGLRHNYANEGISKFTDSTSNIVGNKQETKKGTGHLPDKNKDYNIISYEMFRKDPKKIVDELGVDTIIADEIHRLKNGGTSTLKSFYDAELGDKNFIGLTGSVVSNKISDIYNLVDLASGGDHKLGKNKKEFEDTYLRRSDSKKYRGVHKNRIPVVGFNHKNKLRKELKKYIDFADIDDIRDMAKIPHKDVNVEKVPLSKEQAKYYKQLIKQNKNLYKLIRQKRLETLKDDELAKAFNDMIEARKLVNNIGSVVPGISVKEGAKKSPKINRLLDDMDEHLKNTDDGQAILISHLINGGIDGLEEGLKDRGYEYGKFIGKGNKGVTEETRQKDIKDYKDRKKRVMLISGAGAEGLSLGDTTWEGVLDGHYNPEKMNQIEARGVRSHGLSHRDEDDRRISVNRYISTMPKTLGVIKSPIKTPDEMIYQIAENKDKQNQLLFKLLKENHKSGVLDLFD